MDFWNRDYIYDYLAEYNGVLQFDYFVIQGIIFTIVLCVAFATLVLDLIYPILDPRISYTRG